MPGFLDNSTTVADNPGPWSILIYGDYGAGKTVLACQAEGAVLMDCENSRQSLLNHPDLFDTPIRVCDTLSEASTAKNLLANDDNPDIKTVIVDTLSTLHKKDLDAIMKPINAARNDLPSQAEFNRNNRRISRFVDELTANCFKKGRNIILLCHIREEKDDDGNTTLIRPGISEGLVRLVAPGTSAIFYLEARANSKGEVKRTLRTVATNKVKGKNRFKALPTAIEDPHFSMIEKAIEEQRQVAIELQQQKQQTKEVEQNA